MSLFEIQAILPNANVSEIVEKQASLLPPELEKLLLTQWISIENWKWIVLFVLFTGSYFLNKSLRSWIIKIKKSLQHKLELQDKTFTTYFLDQNIEKGLSWIVVSLFAMIVVENLELSQKLDKYLFLFLKLSLSVHLIRLAYFAADASGLLIQQFSNQSKSQVSDQLAPLATKTLKVFVLITGTLIVLQNVGVNVTALLAGLGLGGVAIAFAAQDTVANVFGTITILLDSPFRIGDRIKMGEIDGIVSEVGFRSTRIRTFYNSIITIPNSVVAKEKIDNYNRRNGLCRFRQIFGFTYTTEIEQINEFKYEVVEFLKKDSRIDLEQISVHIHQFGASSIDVLINFHFQMMPEDSEQNLINNYLNEIYLMTKKLNLNFAFPTQTLIVEKSK